MSPVENNPPCSATVLHRDPRAPRHVRRLVHDMGARSALPARTIDNAMLVASELVTTSFRQAQGPLIVEMTVEHDDLTLRVRYSAPVRTAMLQPALGAMRSWDIVKRLSTSFGYTSDGDEHELWANLSASTRQGIGDGGASIAAE